MFYVGADGCRYGCKKGWVAVKLAEGNNPEMKLFPNIEKLWEEYKDAELILIDIPIGLPDKTHKERRCDREAKEWLGKRQFSVLPVPCRRAVDNYKDYKKDYNKTSEINKEEIGKGLSRQSCGIIPRIKEVDQFLSGNVSARARVREIHPEVCFWALNHGEPMQYSKKEKDQKGIKERKQVLRCVYPQSNAIFKHAEQKYAEHEYLHKDVGWDDILDALVAAVTAYKGKGRRGLKSIPEKPERDSHDLPMEMVYCLS
jgi:predicted RNase H-like nuclease